MISNSQRNDIADRAGLAEALPPHHTPLMRRVKARILLPLVAILILLTGCAGDAELDTLEPQGPSAREIDGLLNPVLWVSLVVFTLVMGATLFAVAKGRVKGEYEEGDWPEQIHGNDKLEVAWTIVPALIVGGIGIWTLVTLFGLYDVEANAYAVSVDGETVQWEPHVVVVGHQWWWEYRYYFDGFDADAFLKEGHANPAKQLPEADIVTSGQMVIPAGQEIELSITSRDVIHSHWIPALNGKRDAVPGRISPWELEADEQGYFFGQCTEFCGLSHSRMRMQTIAMTDSDFQSWVDQQLQPASLEADDAEFLAALAGGESPQASSAVQRGLANIRNLCSACHLVEGVNDDVWSKDGVEISLASGAAPNLTHFASRTTFAGAIFNTYNEDGSLNRNKLESWLRDPAALKANDADNRQGMPNLGLSEDQIDDLVAALESLGPKPAQWIIEATVDIE